MMGGGNFMCLFLLLMLGLVKCQTTTIESTTTGTTTAATVSTTTTVDTTTGTTTTAATTTGTTTTAATTTGTTATDTTTTAATTTGTTTTAATTTGTTTTAATTTGTTTTAATTTGTTTTAATTTGTTTTAATTTGTATTATTITTTTTRPMLNTASQLSVFWVTTVIYSTSTIQTTNSTVQAYFESQLTLAYTQAYSLQLLQTTTSSTTGRRKRYAASSLSTSLLLQLVSLSAASQASQYNLVYYVQSQGTPIPASTVVTTMSYLSGQQLALYLGNVVVTIASVYQTAPTVVTQSNLWIVGAVLGTLGGLAVVIWFSLLIYYRCIVPDDEKDEFSEDQVFAPRASSFRVTSGGVQEKQLGSSSAAGSSTRGISQVDTSSVANIVTSQLKPQIETMLMENQRTIDRKVEQLSKSIQKVTSRQRENRDEATESDQQVSEEDGPEPGRPAAPKPRRKLVHKRTAPATVASSSSDTVVEEVTLKTRAKTQAAPQEISPVTSEEPAYSETIGTAEQMQKILNKIGNAEMTDGNALSPLHVSLSSDENRSEVKQKPAVDEDELVPLSQPSRLIGVEVITVNVPEDRYVTVLQPPVEPPPPPVMQSMLPARAQPATVITVQASSPDTLLSSGIDTLTAGPTGHLEVTSSPRQLLSPTRHDETQSLQLTDASFVQQNAKVAPPVPTQPAYDARVKPPTLSLVQPTEQPAAPRVLTVLSAEPAGPSTVTSLPAADPVTVTATDHPQTARTVPKLNLSSEPGGRPMNLETTSNRPQRLLDSIRSELKTLGTPRTPKQTTQRPPTVVKQSWT